MIQWKQIEADYKKENGMKQELKFYRTRLGRVSVTSNHPVNEFDEHIRNMYGYLLPFNTAVSGTEFSDLIAIHYDMETPRHKCIYEYLRGDITYWQTGARYLPVIKLGGENVCTRS